MSDYPMIGSSKEFRMEARTLMQRWPVSAEVKRKAIQAMENVLDAKNATHRDKVMAAKALMAAEGQNQADEHIVEAQSDSNRFLEIADRLGLRGHVEGTAAVRTGGAVERANLGNSDSTEGN